MAKTKISEFSSTPANNTDIDSINIAEGCAPSGINDAIRELMAQLKDFQTGAQGDSFNGPIGTSTAAAGAFTTLSATGAITSTLATGSAPLVIASTTKVANLNVDLLDGADWASPAALGSTTPAAVSATTLAASSTVTLSGGTANGVAYLNGSKVVTSGSALTFDGTNLSNTGRFIVNNAGSAAGTTDISLGSLSGGAWLNTPSATVGYLAVAGSNAFRWDASNLVSYIGGSEQMRLTSTGLGIGTSGPSFKLHVVSSTNAATTVGITNADTSTANYSTQAYFRLDVAGNHIGGLKSTAKNLGGLSTQALFLTTAGAYPIAFGINDSATPSMVLDTSGNLGIGASSPAAKLDVTANAVVMGYFRSSGGSANDQRLTFTSGGGRIVLDAATNSTGASSAFAFTLGGTEGMRLTTTGLGIGTSSPTTKLDVVGSGDSEVRIRATSDAALIFSETTANKNWKLKPSAGDFYWQYSATAYNSGYSALMALTSAGNLGLGVTPSAWSGVNGVFEIKGNAYIYSTTGVLSSGANAYFNGTNWIYKTTQAATRYEQVNGLHKWDIAASGTAGNAITFTQAMTLTAGGNLGIGATSMGTTRLVIRGDASTNFAVAKWSHSSNASSGFDIGYASSAASNDVSIWNYENGFIRFATNNSERCRIDSSGNLLVGTTSQTSGERLSVVSASGLEAAFFKSGDDTNASTILIRSAAAGTGPHYMMAFQKSTATTVGTITHNDTSTSYNTSSDYRLKNTIAPMTGALDKVALLKPCTYKWNADGSDGEGFIAHELAEVMPHAVTGEKDAVDENGNPKYQGIDTSFLVATLTAAIQELKAEFDAYKASHP